MALRNWKQDIEWAWNSYKITVPANYEDYSNYCNYNFYYYCTVVYFKKETQVNSLVEKAWNIFSGSDIKGTFYSYCTNEFPKNILQFHNVKDFIDWAYTEFNKTNPGYDDYFEDFLKELTDTYISEVDIFLISKKD